MTHIVELIIRVNLIDLIVGHSYYESTMRLIVDLIVSWGVI